MAKRTTKTKPNPEYIIEQLWPLVVPIGDLILDPQNARQHGKKNIGAIVESLRRYKQREPIVVNKPTGIVLAGNGRVLAARELGWEYLAVVYAEDDEKDARGFALADNRTAELAEWDGEKLQETIRVLREDDEALYAALDLVRLDAEFRDQGGTEQPVPEIFEVVIQAESETEQKALFERFQKEGMRVRLLTQ